MTSRVLGCIDYPGNNLRMEQRILYRWRCPYCDVSRSSSGEGDPNSVHRRATNALHGHVSASAEGGHGTQHSVPESFDPDSHIERISE